MNRSHKQQDKWRRNLSYPWANTSQMIIFVSEAAREQKIGRKRGKKNVKNCLAISYITQCA